MNDSTVNKIELLFSEISHENIVRYFDHFHMSVVDENKTFLITEYCQVSVDKTSLPCNHLIINTKFREAIWVRKLKMLKDRIDISRRDSSWIGLVNRQMR